MLARVLWNGYSQCCWTWKPFFLERGLFHIKINPEQWIYPSPFFFRALVNAVLSAQDAFPHLFSGAFLLTFQVLELTSSRSLPCLQSRSDLLFIALSITQQEPPGVEVGGGKTAEGLSIQYINLPCSWMFIPHVLYGAATFSSAQCVPIHVCFFLYRE